ncbi:MAG: hypothetical protein IPM57_00375 [Oligoflexia bacterium]|nr:hypothetical protein [Oligoflexia bacterium]
MLVSLLLALILAQAETPKPVKLGDYLKNLTESQVLEKIDSQGKNNPDIFIVFEKKEDSAKTMLMQLFDINRDGKIDLVKHFKKAKLVRTETDLDYDGVSDVESEYDGQSGELKKKTQADGATFIWKYYFKNELRKKELDRNSDGKPDMWVYYRGGKILRTEIDKDFNGKIVRVEGSLIPEGAKTSKVKDK